MRPKGVRGGDCGPLPLALAVISRLHPKPVVLSVTNEPVVVEIVSEARARAKTRARARTKSKATDRSVRPTFFSHPRDCSDHPAPAQDSHRQRDLCVEVQHAHA